MAAPELSLAVRADRSLKRSFLSTSLSRFFSSCEDFEVLAKSALTFQWELSFREEQRLFLKDPFGSGAGIGFLSLALLDRSPGQVFPSSVFQLGKT